MRYYNRGTEMPNEIGFTRYHPIVRLWILDSLIRSNDFFTEERSMVKQIEIVKVKVMDGDDDDDDARRMQKWECSFI